MARKMECIYASMLYKPCCNMNELLSGTIFSLQATEYTSRITLHEKDPFLL